MEKNKEELLKEYFKVHGVASPIAKKENESNPAIFEWIWKKISDAQTNEALRREEVKVLMRQVLDGDSKISELQSLLEAADEVIKYGTSPRNCLRFYDEPKYDKALEKYQTLKQQKSNP